MHQEKRRQQLQIFFDGATWKLNEKSADTIFNLVQLFEDFPELNKFVQGFLCENFISVIRSYFPMFIFLWMTASFNQVFSICLTIFIFYVIFIFAIQKVPKRDISPNSEGLHMALSFYFTYRRIYAYMSWGKAILMTLVLLLAFFGFPPIITAILIPTGVCSILLETETSVGRMRVMIM
ncbi:hypothetical protein TVAG_353420 [Trichomonas vaginalis G3]|uniref:PRA1 family protein n=1 Tax=Trichomonas vaginalis (strain ATCC PRA-98 / G3) TaxID=412133 RepID=A2EN64_TRIV3|nr:hypothetical protein TVAGG3_0546400 [Trichomonas vaginalis G3]EAY05901.1 hypothetical protein TVAG_353420 [Trichomonas vaginalis G3]KAI5520215.1 hypothetical protein TVAGG3_0546400 [Trichomonas vaginalis G3]|eukprot:XP_001318124.1 hypothetical protein [Trichomonas vaginalis G3]